jgi:hypothetical protein
MNLEVKHQLLLKILLIACIVSTGIHFTDNYLYFEKYPQPDWITPPSVYISWVVWTVVGVAGYWLCDILPRQIKDCAEGIPRLTTWFSWLLSYEISPLT